MAVTWISGSDTSDPYNENAEAAAKAASWILYKLTAEKYPGIRSAVEWYGTDESGCWACTPSDVLSVDINHIHRTLGQRSAYDARGLRLRHAPIVSISSVTTNQGVLSSSEYRVANRAYLVKSDRSCWNLTSGIVVDYEFGINPPAAGLMAAKKLANELMLAATDSEECTLPARVQSITRQGIDYTVLDPQDFINEGRSGIYEIDLFIAASNPEKARKKPRVFSAHKPRGERYL